MCLSVCGLCTFVTLRYSIIDCGNDQHTKQHNMSIIDALPVTFFLHGLFFSTYYLFFLRLFTARQTRLFTWYIMFDVMMMMIMKWREDDDVHKYYSHYIFSCAAHCSCADWVLRLFYAALHIFSSSNKSCNSLVVRCGVVVFAGALPLLAQ